ncbi:MAG: cation:proton antiporter [Thermoplasmata archaeon]|nr:cation:proton antiporter [Thermoplasmata archaeon]
MALDVLVAFAGIGAIICIGFLGSLLFERTKVPDILILIFIGLFLGPIWAHYAGVDSTIIPQGILHFIAPYFAALALVIILFDGGLNLKLEQVMNQLGVAILHTGIAFIGTMFATAMICYFFLGISNIVIGLLLGCILGGISSAVVLPIMSNVSAKEDTKTLLSLESVLSDVLCIVTALILIEILKGQTTETGALIQHLLSAFILAGVIGLLFGVLWLTILKQVHGKPFSFMITIAALLILYAGVEYIQVSGAIAALVFGLVLSNKDEIARMFKLRSDFVFEEKIKEFHSEVSFMIRTFFFVYLGLTFTLSSNFGNYLPIYPIDSIIPDWVAANSMYLFFITLSVIFLGIFVVRYIGATVTTTVKPDIKEDKSFLYVMIPRGLAAAVLASLPFTIIDYTDATVNPEYRAIIGPHEEMYLNMAFMMIVVTVIATTIGISLVERSRAKAEKEDASGPEGTDWREKSRMWKKHSSGTEITPDKKHADKWKESRKKQPKTDVVRVHPPTPSAPVKKTAVKSTQKSITPSKVKTPSISAKKITTTAPKPVPKKMSPLARRAEKAKSLPPPPPKKKGKKDSK